MADQTKIEWADATWNPATGCTKVSRGCRHCYIDRTPAFRIAGRKFVRGATDIQLHPDRLDKPLRWRKPRRVFVNSLSDLFHEAIPDDYIARVFETMRCAPKHTFQVLTKRPERALEWFSRCGDAEGLGWITHDGTPPAGAYRGTGIVVGDHDRWPLPNVWVGVSIEDASYTWRADVLRRIPAAVRFISAEPLLGSLYPSEDAWSQRSSSATPPSTSRSSTPSTPPHTSSPGARTPAHSAPRTARSETETASSSEMSSSGSSTTRGAASSRAPLDLTGIDWVIAGAESGHRARPMNLDWVREIRDACEAHGAAFFFKQDADRGRKIGTPELDGRQWIEFPDA